MIINLTYSGLKPADEPTEECLKTEVQDVDLSEQTCGNGNSDLYQALKAMIDGQPLPIVAPGNSFSASVYAQDLVGNGYQVEITKGKFTIEQVTDQPHDLFDVYPDIMPAGQIDLEQQSGWVLDKIWSATWAGSVYDANGKTTNRPAIKITGTSLVLTPPEGVYGTLSIKYELTRDKISVNNDTPGDYSTSLIFDVDGCSGKTILDLPAQGCLFDQFGYPWEDDPDADGGDLVIKAAPPKEYPYDTERIWGYCTKKFISADPEGAAPADPDAYFGINPHDCDKP